MGIPSKIEIIDLVTVLEDILTSRQAGEKLQCLDENLMSNNFRKTNVLKKNREDITWPRGDTKFLFEC